MSQLSDLTGQRVLVLEDDYYLATDAAAAVQAAGGIVVGPFASEQMALQQIASAQPNAALLDINLGAGPTFDAARALQRRGVPFLFMTGYDQDIIPEEFASVSRFQKPVETERMLSRLHEMLGA